MAFMALIAATFWHACWGAVAAVATEVSAEHSYGLMIDSGSEGSRIYLFRWIPTCAREIVIPEAFGNMNTVPGIASFALAPAAAGGSLKPLVEYAKQFLRAQQAGWHRMPLYLRATAGMRLLSENEREDVLFSVRKYLGTSPFDFQDDHAYVATGEEEGIFGWITVNHMLGNLKADKLTHTSTVGALDLGGASSQIVFIPEKSIMANAFPLQLGPHRFRVYSTSYLHFGQREAAHRTASVIISKALLEVQSVSEVRHPCFSLGYAYHPKFSYNDQRSLPIDVRMNGSSDFSGCRDLLQQIFSKDSLCLVPSCSFYGVYQPHVHGSQFVAFSHFAEVAHHLALPPNAQLYHLQVAAEYVCSLSVQQLDTIFERVALQYERDHLCFHSTYILVLLTYGYGFPLDTDDIAFKRHFDNGEDIDYVVGAMIYQINQEPEVIAGNCSAAPKALPAGEVAEEAEPTIEASGKVRPPQILLRG